MPAPLVLVASVLLAAAPSTDESGEQARQHTVAGNRAFDLGRYDEAIDEFQKAYLLKDAPALLYNIAQAYRLAARPEEAMRFYQKYLAKAPDAANREDVERKIATLRKINEAQKQSLNDRPNEPLHPQTDARAGAALSRPAPPEAVAAPAPAGGWSRKNTAALIGGTGAAALLASGLFALRARSASNQMTAAAAAHGTFDPSLDSSGRNAQTLSRVLGVAGVLAVGTSATLFYLWRGPVAVQATPAGASARVAF